jgi:hypothetical protein
MLALATYAALAIEFSFPVLAFWRRTRWLALALVGLLQIGIDVLMAIRFSGLGHVSRPARLRAAVGLAAAAGADGKGSPADESPGRPSLERAGRGRRRGGRLSGLERLLHFLPAKRGTMRRAVTIVGLVVVLLVGGCAQKGAWTKAGMTSTDLARDDNECRTKARHTERAIVPRGGDVGTTVVVDDRAYGECLTAKGYQATGRPPEMGNRKKGSNY